MLAKGTKNINVEASIELWKKIKILSISKDKTLQEVIIDILEKSLSKKVNIQET